jgi:predicted XRE-type DNA-binding protein
VTTWSLNNGLTASKLKKYRKKIFKERGYNMENYRSVANMLTDIFDDDFSTAVQNEVNETTLISELVKQRIKTGKNQVDLASILNWSVSKVSRLEDKTDKELKIGELVDYCKALGSGIAITIASPVHNRAAALMNCVTQIDTHLRELSQLASECDDDKSIADGITKFQADVLLKMMTHAAKHTNDIVNRIDFAPIAEKRVQLQKARELIM